MITLTEQDIQDLTNFANEIPTKFGTPILVFLDRKLSENGAKEEEGNVKDITENNE